MVSLATSALSSAASASPSVNANATSGGTLAQNFETFLGLLTTQLKNQNPLDPLNTNEFTQQLVQFASVEQQLKTNDSLSPLLTATKATAVTGAMGFVGARVTADGATTRLASGAATWRVEAPRTVANATVTIRDMTGNVVRTETRSFQAGAQSYVWNGRTSAGAPAPDGDYRITIDARDPAGQNVAMKTEIVGTVDGVDVTGSEPILSVGGVTIPVSKVKTIQRSQ